jgi:formylglycine-generating enzyme
MLKKYFSIMGKDYQYDIALSFAEEDHNAAIALKLALIIEGVREVYYYPEHTTETWGKPLATQLAVVYAQKARYAVVLISKEYFKKRYTRIEWAAIRQRMAQDAPMVYMLPVLLGTDALKNKLPDDVAYLKWNHDPGKIAREIKLLLGKTEKEILQDAALHQYHPIFENGNYQKVFRNIWWTINWVRVLALGGTVAVTAVSIIWGITQICLPHKNEKTALPGGSFIMGIHSGRAADMPAHTLTVKPFTISSTEITVRQYRIYCDSMQLPMPLAPNYAFTEDCPVVNITWQEAVDYCKWAGGRLPTEAEWEYAAALNGKPTDRYSGSNNINKVGYYETNSTDKAHPVAQKCGGKLGLHDMSGNVAEWCADWYAPYSSSAQTNLQITDSSSGQKVVRGGHYASHVKPDPEDNQLRITYRSSEDPAARKPYIGLRVVWDQ